MSSSTEGYRDAVARYFREHPRAWIPARRFVQSDPRRPGHTLSGECGWRTRISECRVQLRMDVKNAVIVVRRRNSDGTTAVVRRISVYAFIPAPAAVALEREANGQLAFGVEP